MTKYILISLLFLITSCNSLKKKNLYTKVKEPVSHLTCYFFFIQDCPASKYAMSKVAEYSNKYSDTTVKFIGVYSDPIPDIPEMEKVLLSLNCNIPIIIDSTLEIASKYESNVTPQFILMNQSEEKVFYNGRIDDYFISFGKHQSKASENYLYNALETLITGSGKFIAKTEPIGCKINFDFFLEDQSIQ